MFGAEDIYNLPSDRAPVLTQDELRAGSMPGGTFFEYLDIIRGALNRIETYNFDRLNLKDEIELKGPKDNPRAGYNEDTPETRKYWEIVQSMKRLEIVVQSNVPKLFGVLYEIKKMLIDRYKNGGVQEQSLDTVSYTHLTLPTILLV